MRGGDLRARAARGGNILLTLRRETDHILYIGCGDEVFLKIDVVRNSQIMSSDHKAAAEAAREH